MTLQRRTAGSFAALAELGLFSKKVAQLYHFTDPESHAQIHREGVLRPLDEVHPEKANDYKGRGITAEQELRKQKLLKPDEPYTNFGVFTTPLPPGSIDRSWFKGPHHRVRSEDIPKGSVLAYRHPDTGRTIRRPYSEKEVAKALALWTPPRIEAYLQDLEAREQKTGKKRFPFLKLPQVVSFSRVPIEKTSTLYHGSPRLLDELVPRDEHGDPRIAPSVFATPSRTFALPYAGKKWGDRDIAQSTRGGGKTPFRMLLREMRPDAFKDIFDTSGYLYHLPEESFSPIGGRTRMEVMSPTAVKPQRVQQLANVLRTLKRHQDVELLPYDPQHKATRRAIEQSIKRMREMSPAGQQEYRKWRLENAPPEIRTLFENLEKKGAEFAPGIPKGRPIARLPAISSKTLNRWVLAVQEHEAERAGKHYDLRLVDPDSGKAHSWAIPKAKLPAPGERLLAIQTFTHTPEYALHFGEKKPQTIGQGYGKGRVWMALKEPTDIIESSNNHVRFNVYQGKDISEYLLRRTHENKWLLQNTTITKDTAGVPQSRPKYRETTPDKVDVTDDSHLMMAKIDGAHNLFRLDAGNPVRIFSYRPSERDTGIIEHTHRFVPGLTARIPPHLDGLVLRGELFAADPHTGQARQAVETGAVLNSGVWKSRDAQAHSPLRAVVFDVARRNGQNVESISYQDKLEILRKVNKALPFLELPPMAETTKEKVTLLNRIRTGQEPTTAEGVVLWPLQGGAPVKAKFKPDHDVYVREIFPETGARGEMAGGFAYSWTPQGKIVGRVGTGFNFTLKKDMLENPQKYIGRVARVEAQSVYRNATSPKKPGALRAPSFKDWHLDKGLQSLDKDR